MSFKSPIELKAVFRPSTMKTYWEPGDEVVVKVKVFRKDSLVQAEWEPVGEPQTVSVGVHSQEVSVPLPSGTDYTSGFYRVEIEQ